MSGKPMDPEPGTSGWCGNDEVSGNCSCDRCLYEWDPEKEVISFHQAWGEAKDRADYNKQDWKGAQTLIEQRTFTRAGWVIIVLGMHPLAPDAGLRL